MAVRDERGFTLIEVIVVMTIVSVLVWAAMPHSFASDEKVYTLAQQIKSDIRYAQQLAMTSGTRHRIRFYAASNPNPTNRYDVVTAAGAAVLHPLTRASSFVVDLAAPPWAGLSLDTTATIEFDALGRPDAGRTISLNGGAKTVVVSAETGRVSLP